MDTITAAPGAGGRGIFAGDVVELTDDRTIENLMVMHGVWVKRNEYNMPGITRDTEDQ